MYSFFFFTGNDTEINFFTNNTFKAQKHTRLDKMIFFQCNHLFVLSKHHMALSADNTGLLLIAEE